MTRITSNGHVFGQDLINESNISKMESERAAQYREKEHIFFTATKPVKGIVFPDE